ncbi:MAG: hypothetical protein ACK5NN_11370, partial [Sphingomonadaceae bacterium]
FRVLARTTSAIAFDMNQWQYADIDNVMVASETGSAVFTTAFKIQNVGYWNHISNIELAVVVHCIDVADANNLMLDNINWVKFGDIGQKTFLKFSGAVSMIKGRNLSIEGVFKTTTLVLFNSGSYGIDLEFIRVEGRSGSSNVKFLDFGGAKGNRVYAPFALYGIDAGVFANEDGNELYWDQGANVGVHRMGNGYAVLPRRSVSRAGAQSGSIAFDTASGRFVGVTSDPREFVQTPANNDQVMNGYNIRNINSITGAGNAQIISGTRGAAVANATNATDVITQLNALLARLRSHGLIET